MLLLSALLGLVLAFVAGFTVVVSQNPDASVVEGQPLELYGTR